MATSEEKRNYDPPADLFGRAKIFTATEDINETNVIDAVNKALTIHFYNKEREEYLYWYRRNRQSILGRTKDQRPEINNKPVVNTANQIVVFKNGYFLTKPAFYVSRKENKSVTNKIRKLNEYLYTSGKQNVDNEVVNWFHTVGLGVLLVEPNKDSRKNKPVNVYALDPRSAFVVYSLRPGNKPVFAVNMVQVEDRIIFDVFTEKNVYKLYGGEVGNIVPSYNVNLSATAVSLDTDIKPNVIGKIPIIEYQYDENRMGAFEPAISLLDEINNVQANRIDGVEQFIQSLMLLKNCHLGEDQTAETIRKSGVLEIASVGENPADVEIFNEQLDQNATQTLVDDLTNSVYEVCGVPSNVRDSVSTSDNVGAVYLRSGWAMAETMAMNTEDLFKKANRLFDEVFLKIIEIKTDLKVDIDDFDICFVRNDMTNILAKTQTALNMKNLGFSPELAFEKSGLSNDPVNDVEKSREYIDAIWTTEKPQENKNGGNTNGETIDTAGESEQQQ